MTSQGYRVQHTKRQVSDALRVAVTPQADRTAPRVTSPRPVDPSRSPLLAVDHCQTIDDNGIGHPREQNFCRVARLASLRSSASAPAWPGLHDPPRLLDLDLQMGTAPWHNLGRPLPMPDLSIFPLMEELRATTTTRQPYYRKLRQDMYNRCGDPDCLRRRTSLVCIPYLRGVYCWGQAVASALVPAAIPYLVLRVNC